MTRSCQRCGARFEPNGSWHRLCWRCWREDRDTELRQDAYRAGFADGVREARAQGLDDATLKGAVALCHPDRHPGREAQANAVTAALLAAREAG